MMIAKILGVYESAIIPVEVRDNRRDSDINVELLPSYFLQIQLTLLAYFGVVDGLAQ